MKSCPTCNRTFEDTLTFCLVDGSILSAPFDPQATLVLPEKHIGLPPTEAAPVQAPSRNKLQTTMPSSQVSPHFPNLLVSPEQEHDTTSEAAAGVDRNIYIVVVILILFAIIIAVVIQQNS